MLSDQQIRHLVARAAELARHRKPDRPDLLRLLRDGIPTVEAGYSLSVVHAFLARYGLPSPERIAKAFRNQAAR